MKLIVSRERRVMFLSALGIYYSISSLILRVDDLMISSGTVVNDCIFKLGLRIFFIVESDQANIIWNIHAAFADCGCGTHSDFVIFTYYGVWKETSPE